VIDSDDVTVERIATTEDTGDPVFEARCGDAYMTFLFPPEEPHDIWVHHVASPESGGMSTMLDYICDEYECELIRFVNVLNENLAETVTGGTIVEETVPAGSEFAGETIRCLDVEWQPTREVRADGGQRGDGTAHCDYCDSEELVYTLQPERGAEVNRCIECLAIEQGQQKVKLPFGTWLDRGTVESPDADDAPDFEAFDPREHDYKTIQAWFRVLARLKDDDPIVERDPDAIGTIFEDTREFLINVMGEDAHKRPSELRSSENAGTDRSSGGEQA